MGSISYSISKFGPRTGVEQTNNQVVIVTRTTPRDCSSLQIDRSIDHVIQNAQVVARQKRDPFCAILSLRVPVMFHQTVCHTVGHQTLELCVY